MLALSLASVLGWTAEPNVDQARAIAEIQKLGGEVTVDEKSPEKPVIDVQFVRATDAGLEYLKGLTTVRSGFCR